MSILLSAEMEVDGNLKVTGTVESATIDSLNQEIDNLKLIIAQLQAQMNNLLTNGDCQEENPGIQLIDACGICGGDNTDAENCPNFVLSFDGVNDYVIIEGFESTESLTMSIWFKPENNLSNPIGATCLASFSNWTGNPNSSGYSDFIGNHAPHGSDISGLFAYSGSDGQSYIVETTTSTWINTEWHNITYTRDSDNNQVIYVDGVDQDTDIIIGEPYWINTLFIGGLSWLPEAPWYNVLFNGDIDDVSVWDIALSPADINYYIMENNITGNEPNLNGYWNFNEGGGSTANDLSTHGRTGEIWGNPVWVERD